MRSTRASAAIERLKQRSGNPKYSMLLGANGLFSLTLNESAEPLSAPLQLDDFIKFVNAFGPQTPKRISKLDIAFEKQLVKKIHDSDS